MSKFKIVLHTLGLEYIREGEENTPILHEKGSGLGLVFSVLCHLNGGKKNASCNLIFHFSDVFC